MNRWDLMEAFVRVLHAGSFSAAAAQMDVSKSLLSKKVSKLERNLGTQLLVRTTRRLHPTDAGQAFFQQCERLLDEYDRAEQSMLNLDVVPRGHLRVACTDILGERYVSTLAAEFASLHAQLRIDVHVTSRQVDIVSEGYDLAIRYGELSDSSLKARKVYELPHIVCASPKYLAKHGKPSAIEHLKEHNCLVATFDPCATWRFRKGQQTVAVELQGSWRSNNASALIAAALEGVGICRLPELYVRSFLRNKQLVPILEKYRSAPLAVWMLYPNTRIVPYRARAFIDYFCDRMPKLAGSPPQFEMA